MVVWTYVEYVDDDGVTHGLTATFLGVLDDGRLCYQDTAGNNFAVHPERIVHGTASQ